MVANARALFSHAGFELGLIWRYVGRQYLDNAEDRANSIDPYNVADVSLAYDIGRRWGADNIRFEVRVNNVFDTLYAAGGYMDDVYAVASEGAVYGTPYYIPAATRNVFASVKVDLK